MESENTEMPIAADSFRSVLSALLRERWPMNKERDPKKPRDLSEDEFDMFEIFVKATAATLADAHWFGLEGWFLAQANLWESWDDEPPKKPYSDFQELVRQEHGKLSEHERVVFERLLA